MDFGSVTPFSTALKFTSDDLIKSKNVATVTLRDGDVDLVTKTDENGAVLNGQLTQVGFDQAIALGEYLKQKYEIKVDDIYCRSTAVARTVETMQGIITGIDPTAVIDIDINNEHDGTMTMSGDVADKV